MKHHKIKVILLIVLILTSVIYLGRSDKQYINNKIEKNYLALAGDESSTLLESLTIENYPSAFTFSSTQKEYNIDILENEIELNIKAKAYNEEANIDITGNKYMMDDTGTITITVSKEGLASTVYKINFTKKKLDYKQNFSYKNTAQTFTPNYAGYYKISLWGAQGNNGSRLRAVGGLGGFTSGELFVAKGTPLYFYVGEHRTDRTASFNAGSTGGSSSDTVNGGGVNGYGGGGATDVRLVSGTWNNINSLRSRIMVAGGGGGATDYAYAAPGGAAGGLTGFSGFNGKYPSQGVPNVPPTGGTQVSGGKTSVVTAPGSASEKGVGTPGSFGVGGSAPSMWGSGGGGGYYGGGGAGWSGFSVDSGAGGSSFISGHVGSIAINEDGTPKSNSYTEENDAVHYSGYKFTNTVMIDGKSSMPTPNGTGTQVGNAGSGYAKIELIKLASKNNYLKSIHFDDGVLSSAFNPITEEYDLILDTYVESVNIDWDVDDDKATAIGSHNYKVAFGEITSAQITVTSENGDIRTYTLNISRKPLGEDEHSTKLANILLGDNKLEPVFTSNNTNYSTIILTNIFDLDVTAVPFDPKANIEITGNKLMLDNQGIITIKVTSEVESETIYTINYKKLDAIVEDGFDYTGNYQTFIVPNSGYYKISLWGAQGNNSTSGRSNGGAGGYTSGVIRLEKDTKLYFYVGEHRTDTNSSFNAGSVGGKSKDSVNGGGISGYGGGGATDVRLTPGNWNDVTSLKSRIMVAGGGGGASDYAYAVNGGAAGGLVGFSGYNGKYPTAGVPNIPPTGGTQVGGGKTSTLKASGGLGTSGGFGVGGNGTSMWGSGGGGGYYGGGGAGYTSYSVDSGAGGSSYISGHPGSIAINENGTPKVTTYKSISDSYHYSTRYFTETKMLDGRSEMPTHDETGLMLGNTGNGYANIRLIESLSTNNYLESLNSNIGEFKEKFDPVNTEYNLVIDTYKSAVNITGVAYDDKATVVGNGKYEVEYGETTVAKIQVTSDAGEVKVYTINITRKPLGDDEHTSKLANLKIDKYEKKLEPAFDSLTYDYNVTISNNVINLDIKTVAYDPEATVEITGDKLLLNERGTIMITVREPNSEDTIYKIHYVKTNIIADYEYPYVGGPQTFIAPYTGYYSIELWGAQGNNVANLRSSGGLGAYTKGLIYLEEGTVLYVYIGEHRVDRNPSYNAGSVGGGQNDSVNGGNINGYGGGGASDIRLISGNWNDINSLRSRIMVAAGGGGASNYAYPVNGGAAGGLIGYSGFNGKYPTRGIPNIPPTGGSQINGGATSILKAPKDYGYGTSGTFGVGGNGNNLWGSAGGGGYYGGGGAGYTGYSVDSGAGGSSFISGHAGSIAITNGTSTTPKTNVYSIIDDSYHYSNYIFKDTVMIDGAGYDWTTERGEQIGMPTQDKLGTMVGNTGNGFGKISYVELSANNYLESLTLKVGEEEKDIGFDSLTQDYNITLDPLETEIDLVGVAYEEVATVVGNGTFDVEAGTTAYQIEVTAQNGETRVYTINVTREKSNDAKPLNIEVNKMLDNLCSLKAEYCDYTFKPETENYDIQLPFDLEEIELKAILKNKYQKVNYYKVNGDSDVPISDGNIKLSDDNTYKVVITSEDESNRTEYVYHLERDVAGNNLLKMITITNPDVEITNFKPRIFEYYLNVPGEVTKFDVEAIAQNEEATVEVSATDNFVYGKSNDVVIKVTAPNGAVREYVLHVYREQDTNVFLGNLQVKKGETEFLLSPTFNPYLNNYTVEVDYEYDEVEIVASVQDVNTSIVNGAGVIQLETGNNEVILSVTDKLGNGDVNLYVVNIIRKKNSNALLKDLKIDNYSLEEEFSPDLKEYSVIVPESITSLDVIAIPEIDSTKVTIKGANTLYQEVNTITIETTAQDKTKDTYKIMVYKSLSDNNYLASLTVNGESVPDFDREKLNYEVSVAVNANEVVIEGIPEASKSVVSGNGKYAIASGENIIKIVVESEIRETREYTIIITREKNNNTELLRVENNRGSEVSKLEDGTYIINVQNEINSIEIVGIPKEVTSTVQGNGIFALNVGDNKIPLTVMAEDGTTQVHTVNVIRDRSRNDDLKFLFVEEGGLSPIFHETTVYYEVKVPNESSEVHILAETEDKSAIYEIIGETTGLAVNEERIIVVRVTAEAGNTKDYTLSIVRQEITEEDLSLLFLETNRGSVSPDFEPTTLNYTLEVEHDVTDITITADANNENVRVVGTGKYNLRVGKNAIAVFVIGESGVQRDYQIVVTRKPSSDATLSSLVVKGHALNPTFAKNTLKYKLNTSSDYLDFTRILPTEEDATYEVIDNKDFKVGMNTVKIVVTAPDGVTTLEYVLSVTRDQSKNNNLASLEVVGQKLVPDFNKGINYYTVNVSSDINSVNIKAEAEDKLAVITGVGIKKIEVGSNTFMIDVLSEAGSTKTYTVVVTKDGSSNNNLSNLYTSEGELKPSFQASELEYAINVAHDVDVITVYGVLEDNKATVVGLGDHSLKTGVNEINVSVTSESGDTKVYQILVTRAELISANIISLDVENYELDTEFNPLLTEYFVNVNNETRSLNLSIVLEDEEATYEVLGNEEFVVGINEVIIRVMARDGVTTKDYKLTVNRQMSTNNYLASIETSTGTLNPIFDKENLEYTVEVERSVSKINVNAVTEDESAEIVSGLGEHSLIVGENKINIRVKSSVGVYRTYTLTVKRKKSDNAYLASLELKNGTEPLELNETFVKTDNDYTITVPYTLEYVQIIGIAEEKLSTVMGTGIKKLGPGVNSFEVSVTSEEGTINVYNLVITKDFDVNNKVLNIVPSVGVLDTEFSSDIHEYDLVIPDTENFLAFLVEVESTRAKVTGEAAELIVNDSVRKIVVTNEAGEENVYTFNIVRDKTSLALLKDLKIEGYDITFNPTTLTYNIQVSESKKMLNQDEISAIPMDDEATVNMLGNLSLVKDVINIYTIEVIAKDGYTTQTYTLNITRDSEDYTIRSAVYEIVRYEDDTEEDYVIGIQPSTVISDFKSNFLNEQSMLHVYLDTTERDETDLTATALILKLEKDGYVYDRLRVIVRGDLTNDGKVNITDQVKLINYVGRTVTFNKYEMLAADLTFDGKVNITDQVKLINYVGRTVADLNKKSTS